MTPTHRLYGEGSKAYQAFSTYYDLGDGRTIEKAATKLKKDVSVLNRWSSKYHWVDRIRTADIEEHQRSQNADSQAKLEAARERERRQDKVQEDAWKISQEMLHFARLILRQPFGTLTPDKAARLLQVGDAMARMASGMPVTRAELTGKDGKPLSPVITPIINVTIHRDEATDRARERFGEPPPSRQGVGSI